MEETTKKFPSLPPNYISLQRLQEQQRLLQEQQRKQREKEEQERRLEHEEQQKRKLEEEEKSRLKVKAEEEEEKKRRKLETQKQKPQFKVRTKTPSLQNLPSKPQKPKQDQEIAVDNVEKVLKLEEIEGETKKKNGFKKRYKKKYEAKSEIEESKAKKTDETLTLTLIEEHAKEVTVPVNQTVEIAKGVAEISIAGDHKGFGGRYKWTATVQRSNRSTAQKFPGGSREKCVWIKKED